MTTPAEFAESRFKQNFSCSQAVFSAFASQFGIPDETALKLASPFGGGIARQGHVCGAVTGALMVIGLKHGATTPTGKEETYKVVLEFLHRFQEKHGSVLCRELIDCDMSTPEGWQIAKDKNVFAEICLNLVRDAVEITQPLIK